MNKHELVISIKNKQSFLCVGLDTDITKIPKHLLTYNDPVFEFNKQIIDATKEYCVSYKLNTAFYEANGIRGWESLERTVNYIPNTHFKIADAKRGDIGNTSSQYAKAFFETLNFDAITVAPYMGEDSIKPFLEHKDKVTIVLGLTSNDGAADFELQKMGEEYLYEKVIKQVASWGNTDNLMFVVGATKTEQLKNIRSIIPNHFLLVPGVGFQGGSLSEVAEYGKNKDIGLLVNASRAIIYANNNEHFAMEAAEIAKQYQFEMSSYF
jgi:orotidine-5'-phosphate decarboxylase